MVNYGRIVGLSSTLTNIWRFDFRVGPNWVPSIRIDIYLPGKEASKVIMIDILILKSRTCSDFSVVSIGTSTARPVSQ